MTFIRGSSGEDNEDRDLDRLESAVRPISVPSSTAAQSQASSPIRSARSGSGAYCNVESWIAAHDTFFDDHMNTTATT